MHVSVTRRALEWKVSETYARNGQEEEALRFVSQHVAMNNSVESSSTHSLPEMCPGDSEEGKMEIKYQVSVTRAQPRLIELGRF